MDSSIWKQRRKSLVLLSQTVKTSQKRWTSSVSGGNELRFSLRSLRDGFYTKGGAYMEEQNVKGLMNLEHCEARGRTCGRRNTGELLGTCQKKVLPVCLLLRCWEFILRPQRTFGQFLRVLDMYHVLWSALKIWGREGTKKLTYRANF